MPVGPPTLPATQLPTLRSGAVARYPVLQRVKVTTGLVQFCNGMERRWQCVAPLAEFELTYAGVNSYDMGIMLDFFVSKKGAFIDTGLQNTFTVGAPLGGPTNWCVFAQDEFKVSEDQEGRYSFNLKIVQVRPN